MPGRNVLLANECAFRAADTIAGDNPHQLRRRRIGVGVFSDHDGVVLAKQGRGGHDHPPGDDHDGVVLANQGRGGHDDPPGDDHDGVVLAKQGRGGHDDPPGDDHGDHVVLG